MYRFGHPGGESHDGFRGNRQARAKHHQPEAGGRCRCKGQGERLRHLCKGTVGEGQRGVGGQRAGTLRLQHNDKSAASLHQRCLRPLLPVGQPAVLPAPRPRKRYVDGLLLRRGKLCVAVRPSLCPYSSIACGRQTAWTKGARNGAGHRRTAVDRHRRRRSELHGHGHRQNHPYTRKHGFSQCTRFMCTWGRAVGGHLCHGAEGNRHPYTQGHQKLPGRWKAGGLARQHHLQHRHVAPERTVFRNDPRTMPAQRKHRAL